MAITASQLTEINYYHISHGKFKNNLKIIRLSCYPYYQGSILSEK